MKFIKKKKAFSLVELVISITISSIIFFIVFSYIVESVNELSKSNIEINNIGGIFSFQKKFNNFVRWGYMFISTLWTTTNSVILIKNKDFTDWYIFWVVDKNTMKIEKNYVYWENTIWYRRVTGNEINSIELDVNNAYDLTFHRDKILEWTKIKDFRTDYFNTWTILNIYVSSILNNNPDLNWESLSWSIIRSEDLVEFNFNF